MQKNITFISDRESDIYRLLTEIPDAKTHFLIRNKVDPVIRVEDKKDKLLNYVNHLKIADKRKLLLKKESPRNPISVSINTKLNKKKKK